MARQATCSTCSVRSPCILSVLGQGGWARLGSKLRHLHFGTKETIFHQGVPVSGLYILCQRLVKLVFRTPLGRRVLIRFCRPAALLESGLSGKHVLSAIVVEEAVVTLLPKELALGLLKRQPDLSVEVARRLAQNQHMLLGRLAYLAYGSVRKRLAKGLLELGERFGVCFEEGLRLDLPLSLRDVAEMIGASPQTTSQELHALAKKGLVRVTWPTLLILDPKALRPLGRRMSWPGQ